MANTFITNTSKFKPFSFQEMLQPYAIYTDVYNKTEEELANLDIMAGDVASKLNNPLDEGLRKQYQGFQDELNTVMNDLYDKGLTPGTRKKLAGLKARYTKDLNPINEAYKAYQTDQEYINKMAIEHPEILIEGAGRSVSDYIGGKTPQMRSINTEDLMTEALNVAKTQAGRTYRESGWTSTAGGRFLERSTEVGLNDIDFNNALAEAMSTNTTISGNAQLIRNSINEMINTPSFENLSPDNQRRALNAVIKGVRAGFQYDKKTSTEADPMFAYNLKKKEELEKAKAKKAEQAAMIGSDYFLTPNETKIAYRNTFTNTLGKNVGKLQNHFDQFFNNGKLITSQEVKELESKKPKDYDAFKGYGIGYLPSDYSKNLTDSYNKLVQAFIDLGLNPETSTKEDFLHTLHNDVRGRKRASITSNDSGFKVIQSNLEAGLKNQEHIKEVIGLEKGEDGITRYRTKDYLVKDLFDKEDLNIIRVNMDYHTGERTVMIKTPKGEIKEFLIPDSASYEAEDPTTLANITANIRDVEKGYKTGYTKKDGKLIEVQIPLTSEEQEKELEELYTNADLIFGDIFNIFGANTIN